MRYCFLPLLILFTTTSNHQLSAADPIDTLIRERVMTSPADRPKEQIYDNGAVIIGDLFKSRSRMAIAVSTQQQQILSLACFIHRGGDWQEIARSTLGTAEQPFSYSDEWPMTLGDLDGDTKPELLITEKGGGDNHLVSVWRYNAEEQKLIKVGSGLRNPQWVDGATRGTWKLGFTRGDVGAEEHAWVDGLLTRTWVSEQRYSLHEYLIGSGEPAVHVDQIIRDASGMEHKSTVIGNLASHRNLIPRGEQPRPMSLQIHDKSGSKNITVIPKEDALVSENLAPQWDDILSRALFTDTSAFTSDMTVTLADGKKVVLQNIATITSTPITMGNTYQFFPIDDETRNKITEPADLPALAVANRGTMNWTRSDQAIPAWGAAASTPIPTIQATNDTVLFIRLPNFSGFPVDQIETATIVSQATINDKTVSVQLALTVGDKPARPAKDVARPLLLLNLGKLTAGTYTVNAAITGLPEPHPGKVSLTFAVP